MPSTMLWVSRQTGIERANLCRYVAYWEDRGMIQKVGKAHCPISGCLAGFYTTDPELVPARMYKDMGL
ncbi:MAG: hypothetical protein HYZ16_01420 [Bacteroidetes bacterium]|nr:hypothetical protein [Bacteroidota bacterium]